MILGLSTATFTSLHVVLSLIGIASGIIVLLGMVGAKRLDGWTAGTVVVGYAVAVVFGAIGLVVLYLDPFSTVVVTAIVGLTAVGLLIWLAMVPMES